jgi:hypothetical protein
MPATYEPINQTTLNSNQTSVTFSSIPQTYTDLVVVAKGGSTLGYFALTAGNGSVQTSDYYFTRLIGLDNNTTYTDKYGPYGSWELSFGSDNYGQAVANLNNYRNTNVPRAILWSDSKDGIGICTGRNASSAAINIITMSVASGVIFSGTTFSLYGILAA